MVVYFPEPDERDDTWGEDREKPMEWLRRSTLPRAVSIRRMLNDNLNRFETRHARSLARKLRTDWKSHLFELLVGRYLQELGADVEHEPLGTNGTRVDFRATFLDGVVAVEAVSKKMNLHAVPGRAYMDNSEQRVRLAFRDRRKRRQAEGAAAPVLLAMDGGVFGADVETFDRALLGYGVQHMGFRQETLGFSFDATKGEMAADTTSPWAGVLAFESPGVFGATDPVLYISPHYSGHLPMATLPLRRRMLAVKDYPASGSVVMDGVTFAEPLTEGPD